jgi:8-oxo-dGTP diphosphatase
VRRQELSISQFRPPFSAAGSGEGKLGSGSVSDPKASRRYPDRPVVGVLAVVLRDERALVVRRANPPMEGRWGFPGGVLELGETVAEGAMRELFEETGVVAEPAGILTVLDSIHREDDGRVRYHYALVAVRGIWRSGEGVAGDDADEAAWLDRAAILDRQLPVAPALLPLIELALAVRSSERR